MPKIKLLTAPIEPKVQKLFGMVVKKAPFQYSSLKELYERELYVRDVSQTNIDFILSLIRESPSDENLSIMNNDYWEKLQERDLLDVFEEINKAKGIVWSHSNDN